MVFCFMKIELFQIPSHPRHEQLAQNYPFCFGRGACGEDATGLTFIKFSTSCFNNLNDGNPFKICARMFSSMLFPMKLLLSSFSSVFREKCLFREPKHHFTDFHKLRQPEKRIQGLRKPTYALFSFFRAMCNW